MSESSWGRSGLRSCRYYDRFDIARGWQRVSAITLKTMRHVNDDNELKRLAISTQAAWLPDSRRSGADGHANLEQIAFPAGTLRLARASLLRRFIVFIRRRDLLGSEATSRVQPLGKSSFRLRKFARLG